MSINLCVENSHIELRQTPTWLTNIALYDHNGEKRDWKDTRHIYVGWLRSLRNGLVEPTEEYQMYLDGISGNIEEIMGETYLEFFGV